MKVLVLGRNPSKRGGSSPTIRRLKSWMDALELDFVSFDNVSHRFGSINLKDIDHKHVREICRGYDKILTLGTAASTALDIMAIDHFSLPHPSGLNRQLNQRSFIQQKLDSCWDYIWT